MLRTLILQPCEVQLLLPRCCSWIRQLFMQKGKGSFWVGNISVKLWCFPGAGWRLQDRPPFTMLEEQGFPDTHEQHLLPVKMILLV